MQLVLYSSAFCGACAQTRRVIDEAVRLVPGTLSSEVDVVRSENEAVAQNILNTPTLVIRDAEGHETFRAQGAPTLNQLLVAMANVVSPD